jgi:hypothetical protein
VLSLGAAIVALVVGVGGVAHAAAQKVPLTKNNIDCNGQPTSGTSPTGGSGFANINKTGSGGLIANVVVKGAQPNTTYHIRLIQPASGDCQTIDATLTTDVDGDASFNVHKAAAGGAAFVVLNNAMNPDVDYFTTPLVRP